VKQKVAKAHSGPGYDMRLKNGPKTSAHKHQSSHFQMLKIRQLKQ